MRSKSSESPLLYNTTSFKFLPNSQLDFLFCKPWECLFRQKGTEQYLKTKKKGKILELESCKFQQSQLPFTHKKYHTKSRTCQSLTKSDKADQISNNGISSTSNPGPQISTLLPYRTSNSRP